jgi:NAD(P)-dependent dehydrogenase (short-subunit alcohol dehydrogenase family)
MAGTTAAQWDHMFAVSTRAHFLVAAAALTVLEPGSAIVFISSAASLRAATGIPAYDASKTALLGVCRPVAREGMARGIRPAWWCRACSTPRPARYRASASRSDPVNTGWTRTRAVEGIVAATGHLQGQPDPEGWAAGPRRRTIPATYDVRRGRATPRSEAGHHLDHDHDVRQTADAGRITQ